MSNLPVVNSLVTERFLAIGRHMPRQKWQRPEVYATGKREKLWRGEWHEYFIDAAGEQQKRHKSKTWPASRYTKGQAQAELDKIVKAANGESQKADGTMTVGEFWKTIFFPVRAAGWSHNSIIGRTSEWRRMIQPTFEGIALKDVNKAMIDQWLVGLARAGHGEGYLQQSVNLLSALMLEAVENDFIPKNPTRRVRLPKCKPPEETRSLTEDEVRRLFENTEGRDYIIWRILCLTGARINEVLALTRGDVSAEAIRIDESSLNGAASSVKDKDTRYAPLPASLSEEIQEWLSTHASPLVFPAARGGMLCRAHKHVQEILVRSRAAASIADLTFKMCRTTFATMFVGDIKDVQAILGHHSAAFTLRNYKKFIAGRQQRSVEKMDRKFRSSKVRVMPKRKAS